jgi:hypothetical protein
MIGWSAISDVFSGNVTGLPNDAVVIFGTISDIAERLAHLEFIVSGLAISVLILALWVDSGRRRMKRLEEKAKRLESLVGYLPDDLKRK